MRFATLMTAAAAAALLALPAVSSAAGGAAHGSHASLQCAACHKTMPPKAPDQAQCLTCHVSYAQLAKATKNMNPNPHDSHLGRVNCTECHSMHGQSRFMCQDCHAFKNVKFKGE